MTLVEGESGPVAALVHDPAVLDDPGLRDAVATATALAAANARLTAAVRAQVGELRESRLRILAAGDEERGRLEQRLREGAQARLERLAGQLAALRRTDATADERIGRAEEQLARTLDDLHGSRAAFTRARSPRPGSPARSCRSPSIRRCR